MTGKNGAQSAAAEVSTGGSLISDAKLRQLYSTMVRCRMLAEYAAGVCSKARSVNPYEVSTGQEAIAAGWVTDLQQGDTIALAPGDAVGSLVKGVPIDELIAHLHTGRDHNSGTHNVIPALAALEEQFDAIQAVASANKRKKKRPVVVAFASAATAASAPWQQLVTKAARQKLPIIFVVENNPWPANGARLQAADDFTQKAHAYGLTGISVDGNDVVAVYRVAHESLERVHQGDGPVAVEARTYSEAGRRQRDIQRDPLVQMERYLKVKKLFEPKWKDQVVEQFRAELKLARKAVRQLSA